MKRMFFYGEKQVKAIEKAFAHRKEGPPQFGDAYSELEIIAQEDGRFSVWGNHGEDSDLLQDTRKDTEKILPELLLLADSVVMEE